MNFNRWFVRLHWVSLVLILLIFVAGSVVRTSGSGMGCPDWPKCFGQWVPPTHPSQLPVNYREPLVEKRLQKAERFSKLLVFFGMAETAQKLKSDPLLQQEEPFNARKTWTEYINRLVGFLGGNLVLLLFVWAAVRYRKHRFLLLLSLVNVLLFGFQGWFGSIVVASNLVPWTITLHMLVAVMILCIQVYLLYRISPAQQATIPLSKSLRTLILISLVITIVQMFLGTQVRESIDTLMRQGMGRESWSKELGIPFFIHRSFSWLVLILLALIALKNEQKSKNKLVRSAFIVLAIELISGVLLAYFDLPAWVQVSHLLFATIILGILLMTFLRSEKERKIA